MTGSISVDCYRLRIFGLSEINKINNNMSDHIQILDKILFLNASGDRVCYNMHFIQWKSVCQSDYIWILVD